MNARVGGLGPEGGLAPLWGFTEVIESTVDDVEPGQRLYGYLPPAGLRPHPTPAPATGAVRCCPGTGPTSPA